MWIKYVIYVFLMLATVLHSAKDDAIRRTLLIAGNFSINGERLNLARYDVATNRYVELLVCRKPVF